MSYNTRMFSAFRCPLFHCLLLALMAAGPIMPVAAGPQPGEIISVFAEGTALVEDNDRQAAREKARDKGIEQAFLSIISSLVPAQEISENWDVIRALVETRSIDFVQSYRFMEESLDEDGDVYKIGLQVAFFYDYLRDLLTEVGFATEADKDSRVVLLIDERVISAMPDTSFLLLPSATEENLKTPISRLGFSVISRKQIRELKDDKRVLKAIHGELSSVLWIGESFNAEYVITGSARSSAQSGYETGPGMVKGEIDAAIYDGRTAEVLWEEVVVARVEDDDGTAGFRAIRMAGEKFNRKVLEFMYGKAR